MIINLTICALSTSFISNSPLFSPISSTMKPKQVFQGIHAKNFFTSLLIDHSHFVSLTFSHSSFINFLKSPITVNNYDGMSPEIKIISKNFSSQLVKDDQLFTVIGCNFINCFAGENKRGGAIHYQKNAERCYVTVYSSTFENCNAINGDGGAIFVCKSIGETKFDPTHGHINFFNSSYCCYSKCTANGNNINSGYGPVMFIFANSIDIFYSTVVECPAENMQSYGSQIDLKSSEIYSSYINSTKGKSTYCCAVEYRLANRGNFKYQTFVDLTGGYLTSFSDIQTNDLLNISFCNYVNNTLQKPPETVASFIYVKDCNVFISHFCFVGIKIPENPNEFKFVYCHGSQRSISLSDSFIENNIKSYLDVVTLNNMEYYDDDNNEKPTNKIDLLRLGPCQGNLTPPPTIFSDTFTPTLAFSATNLFSDSKLFSKSNEFSNSGKFAPSDSFTQSSDYSESKQFSRSDYFSKSDFFTQSSNFTKSKIFSSSQKFSSSSVFTETNKFLASKSFTPSDSLFPTSHFTSSKTFSFSSKFSESLEFTLSEMMYVDRGVNIGSSNKGGKVAVIAAVASAAAAAAIIAAVVIVFIIRKRKMIPTSDLDIMNETNNSLTVDNALQSIMDEDDPFATDFKNM